MYNKLVPIVIIAFFIFNQPLIGQTLINWEWKSVTKISYNDIEFKDNFIYFVGNFTADSVNVGNNNYVNVGGSDIIVGKMDTLSNIIWSRHFGSSYNESLNSICIDNNNNVLVIGSMENNLSVASTMLTSIGGKDIMIIKFDSNGNVLLTKNVGTTGDDIGNDITTDYNNDIYAVGDKSSNNLYFAATNNTYPNVILKWSATGTELYMYYMREGLVGEPSYGRTKFIKYSSFDSTIIIGGSVGSTESQNIHYFCHSSNLNLTVDFTASPSWGAKSGSFLCKTNLNGLALKLIDHFDSYRSYATDLATNPINGNSYLTNRVHWPLSQYDSNYWVEVSSDFSNKTNLPITLSYNTSFDSYPGAPLKINYSNNSLYGLLYQENFYSNVPCTDYYAVNLNLTSNASEKFNLDYWQLYSSGVGFNGTFCMGSNSTIGKSCQANCPLPSFSLNPAPDVSICVGANHTPIGAPECFYAKGGVAPYTYSWLPTTGLNDATISNPSVYGLTSNTTYTLSVTDAQNNILYDTVNVIVNPLPVITNSYSPSPFCVGDTVTVSFNGGVSYPYGNPIHLIPNKDTFIIVYGSDSLGCSGYSKVSIETFKISPYTISPIVCKDSIATLLAPSANSYLWQPGNLVGDTITVPVSSSTIFTVTGTDAQGCTATATTSVLLSSSIDVAVSNSNICLYDSVQLSAIGNGYSFGPQNIPLGYCYPPLSNSGAFRAAINNFKFNDMVNNGSGIQTNGFGDFTSLPYTTVSQGSIYSVELKRLTGHSVYYAIWIDYNRNGSFLDPNELAYSAAIGSNADLNTQGSVLIPSSANPGITRMRVCIAQSQSSVIQPCQAVNGYGEFEDYTINIVSQSGLNNFSWTPATMPNVGSPVIASPVSSTTYTVSTTDFLNCLSTNTIAVQVNSPSTSSSNIIICSDQIPYSWNGQQLTANGNYSYQTINSVGCDSTAILALTVNPVPTPTIIWSGTSFKTQPNYFSYQWLINNTIITGANDSIYVPLINGDYSVQVIDSNGCGNTSAIFNFILTNAFSSCQNGIQIFPNPTHSAFTINFPNKNQNTLILIDLNGKKILEKKLSENTLSETINISHLATGVYQLKIIGKEDCNIKILRY